MARAKIPGRWKVHALTQKPEKIPTIYVILLIWHKHWISSQDDGDGFRFSATISEG